jgi:lactoylglutathione lyase
MNGILEKAFGYQGDKEHLPVPNLADALPFYEQKLGFRVVSRSDRPYASAVLARDAVQIGLCENGGDPTQDGCAFHVRHIEALSAEIRSDLAKHEFNTEQRDGVAWKVFFVVAPDGLCFWFGERS